MRTLRLAGLLFLLASCSSSSPPPELTVRDAWARETAPGQTATAVYLTIANEGGRDRLIAAGTSAAARATLHRSSSEGGIARMRPLSEGLEIPAGGHVTLKPGGDHIMVEELGLNLRRGDSITMWLGFERSDERTVRVRIVDAASQTGAAAMHEGRQ